MMLTYRLRSWNALQHSSRRGLSTVSQEFSGSEKFMELYKTNPSPAFAVVKVGEDVVEYQLDALTKTCNVLQELNLSAVVTHGGGPQMNDKLKKQGVEPHYIRGSRVTDAATLAISERIFTELHGRIVSAFKDAGISGISAKGLQSGVFSAEVDQPELGFVGSINSVNDVPVLESLQRGPRTYFSSGIFSWPNPQRECRCGGS